MIFNDTSTGTLHVGGDMTALGYTDSSRYLEHGRGFFMGDATDISAGITLAFNTGSGSLSISSGVAVVIGHTVWLKLGLSYNVTTGSPTGIDVVMPTSPIDFSPLNDGGFHHIAFADQTNLPAYFERHSSPTRFTFNFDPITTLSGLAFVSSTIIYEIA
jgi:hypothetical protein